MDETEKADLDVKDFGFADVHAENDSLIIDSSSPSCLIDQQPLEKNQNEHISYQFVDGVDAVKADTFGQSEQLPLPSESFQPEGRRKIGKCNLRKSLAWDSAFFSGAGVLDAEELSSMIGVENSKKNLLPGIEEDVHRSTDSISTLDSEGLTLETIEADLFQDIRASIQRSSKASNVACSSSKCAFGGMETQALCSLEKVDPAAQDKVKAKCVPKKQTIGMQRSGRMVKQSSGRSEVTETKPVARNGNITSSVFKPPNIIGRANPISVAPSKRASLGASHIKTESNNAKNTIVGIRGAQASKPPRLGSTCGVVPKPAPSSKSSSLGSSTATKAESAKSSSSCDSSSSTSTHDIGKSPLTTARRKTESKTPNPPSSGSTLKTPLKIALKNKSQSGKSSVLAHSMLSKIASSTSPASSISDWSSESSTSTVNQRSSKLRASLESNSSSKSFDSDGGGPLALQMHSKDKISDGRESQVTRTLSQNMKASTRIGGAFSAGTAKPSGLRMPSPKIGFFDGVKSLARIAPVGRQSHSSLPAGSPKVGSGLSPGAGTNKPKLGKVQPSTTGAAFRNTNLDTHKPTSPVVPLQDPPNASTKLSSASKGVKNCPTVSPKVLSKICAESGLDADSIGAKGSATAKHVSDLDLEVEKNGDSDLKEIKVTPTESDVCDSSFGSHAENINSSHKANVDANYGPDHLNNNFNSVVKNNEKEEGHFDDQVDGSSKLVGSSDKKSEIPKEQFGDSISQFCVSSPDSKRSDSSWFGQLSTHCQEENQTNSSKLNPGSLFPTALEITAGTRIPFAVKNSFSNGEGLDLLTGSTTEVVEKTVAVPSLESAHKENS